MKIPKMLSDFVLVKPTTQTRTKGGLYKPQCVLGESALRGTVIGIGPDCCAVKVGDDISFAIFSKYAVPEEEGLFKDHFLMKEVDILFVWEEDGKPEKEV